ncbi:ketimine reductase mu-crystallin [Procambarus clarkii]|uniref:ketimine reductase mu-crystallin n=1 Tax=Procambarus clarkii TaxID=6728 RepID=UPI001E67359B|nr:ketimine reductase mu-crystallin-like [Procambarus clarkii]XP_045609502.1 ketimine reductase mu-crystallin-like [Procambarus clarkii]
MTSTKAPQLQQSTPGWVKWISDEDVFRVLTWDRLLPAVHRSLVAYTQGPDHPQGAVQPLRTWVKIPEHQGNMIVMPGLLKDDALVVKIITHFPMNAARGLSSFSALIVLMRHDSGLPVAILQGEAITELRTAAASAVATREILQGRKDLDESGIIVAVLGAGAQGRSHARVMAHILKPRKIMIWARRLEASQELCETLNSEGIPAEVASSIQEAVKDADVINSCTATSTPILKAEWVKPKAHINSVGAPSPNMQEMEENLVREATVYTDSYEAARNESGDIIKSGAAVFAEIGEVILQTKPVLHDKITIFKSLGLAVEDAVSAQLVYELLKSEENK